MFVPCWQTYYLVKRAQDEIHLVLRSTLQIGSATVAAVKSEMEDKPQVKLSNKRLWPSG